MAIKGREFPFFLLSKHDIFSFLLVETKELRTNKQRHVYIYICIYIYVFLCPAFPVLDRRKDPTPCADMPSTVCSYGAVLFQQPSTTIMVSSIAVLEQDNRMAQHPSLFAFWALGTTACKADGIDIVMNFLFICFFLASLMLGQHNVVQ